MQWMVLIVFMGGAFTLVSSLTLPYLVTKASRHRKYTSSSTSEANVAATTVPGPKGVIFYTVTASNGAKCILFKADGLIEVYFKSYIEEEEEEVDTYMVDDAVIEGNCKYEDSASMRIAWRGFTMIWNFAKTPGGEIWYISQVKLTVNTALIDQFYSNRSHVLPGKTFKLAHKQMLFLTPMGKSYACPETTIDLTFSEGEYNSASLRGKVFLRSFQIQPFIYNGSNFGPAFDCNSGFPIKEDTAPIAVGSMFDIAVLLAVTGYGIFKYFNIKKV